MTSKVNSQLTIETLKNKRWKQFKERATKRPKLISWMVRAFNTSRVWLSQFTYQSTFYLDSVVTSGYVAKMSNC